MQDKNFHFKQNLINRINPEFKRSPFIKQLDFYNDSILIKLNSKWQHKKKQNYVGVFSKLNDHQLLFLAKPVKFVNFATFVLNKAYVSLQGDNIDKLGSYIEKDFTERKNLVKNRKSFLIYKNVFLILAIIGV